MVAKESSAGGGQEACLEMPFRVDGNGALVEYQDDLADEEDEKDQRQAEEWYDTRELQDLFRLARPLWTLGDVDKSVKKLREIGIKNIFDLKRELEEGDVNAQLGRHSFTVFSRTTLRELLRCIRNGNSPRRGTLTLVDKRPARMDKDFWKRLGKVVEEAVAVRELDFTERFQGYVDEHLEDHFHGELSTITEQLYGRLKSKIETDVHKLERRLSRRLDELTRRLDELADVTESMGTAPDLERSTTWPHLGGSSVAPGNRPSGGHGQQQPGSPRRRAFREAAPVALGAACRGDQLRDVAEAALDAAPPQRKNGLAATPRRWATASDMSSWDELSVDVAEHVDDSASEPLSSAREAGRLESGRMWQTFLKTELKATIKEAVEKGMENFQQNEKEDGWTMWLNNQAELQVPPVCENSSEASFKMWRPDDGSSVKQPAGKQSKTHMNLIKDISDDGHWEKSWSTANDCPVFLHSKTGKISFVAPEALIERSSSEPEVTPRVREPQCLDMKDPPEETSKAVEQNSSDLPMGGGDASEEVGGWHPMTRF